VSLTFANDFTAPVASIVAPAAGATVSGLVNIEASASDNVGVTRVDILVDGGVLATRTAAPYVASWSSASAPNGSHSITAKAYDAAGNVGTSAARVVTSANGSTTPGVAAYDPGLRAPRCSTVSSACDTFDLVRGRAAVGPEQNAPNTINGTCLDGTAGSFHGDESLDRLRVTTLDGTPLAAGKTVRVEATVWVWGYSSDRLDLYYATNAASPTWTFLRTITPTANYQQTLSTTFTLGSGPSQAIRGVFRYGGAAAACGTGSYDDRDDLVFSVQ
jgi:leucyl aminopeptidase